MSLAEILNDPAFTHTLEFATDPHNLKYIIPPIVGGLIGRYDGKQDAKHGETPIIMDIIRSHGSSREKFFSAFKRHYKPIIGGTISGILTAAFAGDVNLARHGMDAVITITTVSTSYFAIRGLSCRAYRRHLLE